MIEDCIKFLEAKFAITPNGCIKQKPLPHSVNGENRTNNLQYL